jgi:hypothetical protein
VVFDVAQGVAPVRVWGAALRTCIAAVAGFAVSIGSGSIGDP